MLEPAFVFFSVDFSVDLSDGVGGRLERALVTNFIDKFGYEQEIVSERCDSGQFADE